MPLEVDRNPQSISTLSKATMLHEDSHQKPRNMIWQFLITTAKQRETPKKQQQNKKKQTNKKLS